MALPPDLTELADTYPLPSNATFRAGISKFLNYAKGLLGPTGNAAEARVALGIGPVISYRNLLINATGAINQRVYVSAAATTAANQYTLDRWRVVTSGQNITFGAASPDRTITCPAGGIEQVIEAGWIAGGVYTLAWGGTATAMVNGVAILSGAQTASLPANTAVTIRFTGGTLTLPQFEFGTVATPFERRPPQMELSLCQRYFQKSYALATAPGVTAIPGRFLTSGNLAGTMTFAMALPVPMRSAPAVSLWDQNGNANAVLMFASGGAITTRPASVAQITDHSFEISTVLAGADVLMAGHWTAQAEL